MRIYLFVFPLILCFSSVLSMQLGTDQFDQKFEQSLADIKELTSIGREYDVAGEQDNALFVLQEISSMYESLQNDLVQRSGNKWFLTGNLLEKKLRLSSISTVQTNVGLCIPHTLQTCTPLHHLVSHYQIFTSCGFNSLANAYAIERQVKEGSPITMQCTRKYAEFCFAHTLTRSSAFIRLLSAEGINFADSQGFGPAADDILKNYGIPLELIYLSAQEMDSFEDPITKLPIIELIKSKPAVHFIFNTGAHWVLISVVKTQDTYAMYYLNSANTPIDANQLGRVVRYLDGLLDLAKK